MIKKPRYWTVPKIWNDSTVVCIGSGPSLTLKDAEYAIARCAGCIIINDVYRMGLDADIIYSADERWWLHHYDNVDLFYPLTWKVTVSVQAKIKYPDLQLLECRDGPQWSQEASTVAHGGFSGHQAINIAMLAGARRIILLGYNCKLGDNQLPNFFGYHWVDLEHNFNYWLKQSKGMYALAVEQGVEIVNCTPDSALTEYPRWPLRQVLCQNV